MALSVGRLQELYDAVDAELTQVEELLGQGEELLGQGEQDLAAFESASAALLMAYRQLPDPACLPILQPEAANQFLQRAEQCLLRHQRCQENMRHWRQRLLRAGAHIQHQSKAFKAYGAMPTAAARYIDKQR